MVLTMIRFLKSQPCFITDELLVYVCSITLLKHECCSASRNVYICPVISTVRYILLYQNNQIKMFLYVWSVYL